MAVADYEQSRRRVGTRQQLEPGGGRVGQERKRGWSGSTPGLGQEHGRSGQKQCKSRTGALVILVSSPLLLPSAVVDQSPESSSWCHEDGSYSKRNDYDKIGHIDPL